MYKPHPLTTLLAALTFFSLAPVCAATALSETQLASISENCANIKQVLRNVQREDSRDRVAVGAVYEIIASRYITPLNLRLVANNISKPELISLQSEFVGTQKEFSAKFIAYSRSFESLLASDCARDPSTFYDRLKATRILRAELYALTQELNADAELVARDVYNLQGATE